MKKSFIHSHILALVFGIALGTFFVPQHTVSAVEPAEIVARTIPTETAYEQLPYIIFRGFLADTGGEPLVPPTLNDAGDVLFYANIGGPVGSADIGLYMNTVSGVRRQVARRFTILPGYPAQTSLNDFLSSLITRNADAVMKLRIGGLAVPQGTDYGVWRSPVGSFNELVRSGFTAPQTNPPATFLPFDGVAATFEPLIVKNQNTDIVAIPMNVISNSNTRHGVWMPEITNPLRVMTTYPAPGISNTTISTIEMMKATNGPAVYRGTLSGSGVQTLTFGSATVVNDEAIWRDTGGTAPELMVRKGQVLGGSPSVALSSILSSNYRNPFGSNDNSVLFMGNIVNSSTGASAGQGLWRATGSNFEQIFRTGQVIVNATGFTANTTAAGNDNQAFLDCDGVATYIGTVAGPGVTYLNELALMQETPEGPVIVARARQPAPGTPTGIIFTTSSLAGKFVCANDEAFAFTAQVQGTGVTASNDRGVWYVQNGQPELIFREGMQIEDQLIAEITGAGDHLQVSDTGRVIVKAHLVPVANPFGARSAAMISWAPCEGPTILARLGGPMLLEGGLSQTVHNFSSRTEGMMNRSSEVVLAVTFASSQERDEKVVKFPPVNCNPPCPADFDNNSTVEVSDIFAFLSAWFAQNISADANENGSVAVDDIFAFLSAWFEGC